MRLIDADKLKAKVRAQEWKRDPTIMLALNWIYMLIDNSPTIDAVPVVRCKDCVWFMSKHIKHNDGTITYVGENAMPVSINVGINVQASCCRRDYVGNLFVSDNGNDFCSCGVRKEETK